MSEETSEDTTEDAALPEIIVQPEAEAEILEAFRWYEDKDERTKMTGWGQSSCEL